MKTPRDTTRLWQFLAFVAIASTVLSLTSLHPAKSDGPGLLDFCTNATNVTCAPIGGPEISPVTCADGHHFNHVTDCNYLCQSPSDEGQPCATFDANLCVEAVCGAAGECGLERLYVPSSCNDNNNCTIDSCDACANTCTGACEHRPDLNSTRCNLAPGQPCSSGFQCSLPFCVDGVCCNSACNGASETCNLPGSVGQCVTAAAPAPVVSGRGVLMIGGLLTAIGLVGLRRAVRRPRS